MLRGCLALVVVAVAWAGTGQKAAAHERWYEFDGTHIALSIDRFMGLDYVDFEGPGGGDLYARVLLNASEPVPTTYARFGFDVFLERLSLGIAGGFTSEDIAVIAPRVGYMIGLTPQLGLWLRGGAFYSATPGPNYFGVSGEALFAWFPWSHFALYFGPTLDLGFADDEDPRARDYISIGLPEFGMTAWL
jgi:hypothetical protein